jgi:hypothetical protein
MIASGKYINFLHDDDYLLPGALRILTDIAESSGCYWVYGAYNLIDDEGNLISVTRPQEKGNLFALLVSGECYTFAASLINREAYLRVGGLDPRIPADDDLDLQCQIALLSDFDRTDQVVASVRLSGGTTGTSDWSQITQDYRILREKALNSPGALARMRDSVQGDVLLRGRSCRAYLFSAVLNLLAGHFVVTGSRIASLLRLAGLYPILPKFWRGMFFRSHYHVVERRKVEEYFSTHSSPQTENELQANK